MALAMKSRYLFILSFIGRPVLGSVRRFPGSSMCLAGRVGHRGRSRLTWRPPVGRGAFLTSDSKFPPLEQTYLPARARGGWLQGTPLATSACHVIPTQRLLVTGI